MHHTDILNVLDDKDSAGLGILSVTDGRPDVCTEGFLVSFRLQSLISNDADLF